jgi:hypothetical protein
MAQTNIRGVRRFSEDSGKFLGRVDQVHAETHREPIEAANFGAVSLIGFDIVPSYDFDVSSSGG